jgi:hypothetical protein
MYLTVELSDRVAPLFIVPVKIDLTGWVRSNDLTIGDMYPFPITDISTPGLTVFIILLFGN